MNPGLSLPALLLFKKKRRANIVFEILNFLCLSSEIQIKKSTNKKIAKYRWGEIGILILVLVLYFGGG
jgi:hypothetical protein